MIASDIICSSSFMNEQPQKVIQDYEKLQTYIKSPQTIKILQKKGILYFFPIQYSTFQIIHHSYDLIGRDRTGSGKTIAYSLPIIQRFRISNLFKSSYYIKFLIIVPTRQLCIQVTNQIQSLKLHKNEFNIISLYGGVQTYKHINMLKQQVDIVVATPGRLIDLLEKGKVDLSGIECICLDEADEMLKMGFQKDVEKVYHFANKYARNQFQNLLFSATVPVWVERIALKYMKKDKKFVDLIKDQAIKTSKTVTHLSLCMKYKQIVPRLKQIVQVYCGKHGRCIIFCQRKDQVKQIINQASLQIQSQALHSDIAQSQRQITFKKFKQGELKCLISTNVAARGLDIPNVDLVIQLQPPKNVEDYIHRSGRTGRAGKKGICLTIYLKSEEYLLKNIEKVAKIQFKDIGPPQNDEFLTRITLDIIQQMKSIDEAPLEYFEQLASEFIYEVGSLQAVARALSYITKITRRIPCESILNKQPNKITYKFKYRGPKQHQKQLTPLQIIKFFCQQLNWPQNSKQTQYLSKNLQQVTKICYTFNMPQIYLQKMRIIQKLDHQLYQLSRVSLMSQLTNQRIQMQQFPMYTQDQYQNAIYNNYQIYIGNLPGETDAYQLQRLFHRKGVKFVAVDVKSKEGKKGFAFMKCLTEDDLNKAVELDGVLTFQGRKVEIRKAEEKSSKKEKQHHKEHKHNKEHKHKKDKKEKYNYDN